MIGIGTITTTTRNSGISTAVGSLIYNETTGEVQIYKRNTGWVNISNIGDAASGGIGSPLGLTATGGVINDYTDPGPGAVYRAHIFTSSGTFSVSALSPSLPNNVEYLAVAGGGGGGFSNGSGGGGGGAGGLRTNLSGHPLAGSPFPVSTSPGSYTVTVGGGGASGNTSGANSSFGPITSTGGGYGGGRFPSSPSGSYRAGSPGGSGGGGAGEVVTTAGSGNTPPTSPSQGNSGGAGGGPPSYGAGGGGGAGAPGGVGSGDRSGGAGVQVDIAGPPTFTGVGEKRLSKGFRTWYH